MNIFCLFLFTGVFQDNLVIVAIPKFDQQSMSAVFSDTKEEITEGEMKEETCQFVREACTGVDISPDNVSGRWAYHARMLAMTDPKEVMRQKHNVKKCLHNVQGQACGEGEKLSTSLDELPVSAKLEEASGMEARYSQAY